MKTIIQKVTEIKEGWGRPLPEEIAGKYEAEWLVDPLTANAKLFFFELSWNDIPLPEGSVNQVAKQLDSLSIVRFGPEGYPDGWGIGVYGPSLFRGEDPVN